MTTTKTTKASAAKEEAVAKLVEFFVNAIETGMATGEDWRKPWRNLGTDIFAPINMETERAYRGGNVFILAFTAMANGYTSGQWGTYACFQRLGGQVRKGEHAARILRPNIIEKPAQPNEPGAKLVKGQWFKSVLIGWSTISVFNRAQVDGLKIEEPVSDIEPIEHAEAWLRATIANGNVKFRDDGTDQAYYVPATEEVVVPPLHAFVNAESFYGVAAHELTHWTGHESRLNRHGHRSAEAYALEELVAELGSTIILGGLGIDATTRESHREYLAHWVKAIKAEPSILWTVMADAAKAADHLNALADRPIEIAA